MIAWLGADTPFPPLAAAQKEPNGLLAVGGDLSPRRLLDAYRRGIFPWYSEGDPILWWSPDPRMVLYPGGAAGHPLAREDAAEPRRTRSASTPRSPR